MNIIKIILALLGLIFGVMLFFWVFGLVSSLLLYGLWIAVIGGVGYGAWRLFRKAEDKLVGSGTARTELGDRDFNMSWDEYEKKYLHK
jgi:hypothetical protein